VCSQSGVDCTVDPNTGISTCAGGPNDYCQQQTDLDCDPRCDVGPNAGRSCTTNAFCNRAATRVRFAPALARSTRFASMRPATRSALHADLRRRSLPRRYCSALTGCPGGGVCTQSAACPAGSVCSRQFNEGDTDYFSLGTFAANSKVFALPDSKSANDQDFRMRIVSDTKTLQFNDDDGIGREGAHHSGDRGSARLRRADLHPGQPYNPARCRAVRDRRYRARTGRIGSARVRSRPHR
jgi:hypothetical protein